MNYKYIYIQKIEILLFNKWLSNNIFLMAFGSFSRSASQWTQRTTDSEIVPSTVETSI